MTEFSRVNEALEAYRQGDIEKLGAVMFASDLSSIQEWESFLFSVVWLSVSVAFCGHAVDIQSTRSTWHIWGGFYFDHHTQNLVERAYFQTTS